TGSRPCAFTRSSAPRPGMTLAPMSRLISRLSSMADSTFDIVSKVDPMEAKNAVDQAQKEISQRYDFKGVGADVDWSGTEKLLVKASTEERAKAVLDVVQSKFVKRGIALQALDVGDPYPSGKEFRIEIGL